MVSKQVNSDTGLLVSKEAHVIEVDLLSKAARAGDTEAAATVLRELLPYWLRAAYSILGHNNTIANLEAADLVQEAVLKLLELWSQGQGPDSNTRSYVTSIMRNSYVNRLRSPLVRERTIEDAESGQELQFTDDYREVDLSSEAAAVRRAFADLAEDHRLVLNAVMLEGRKPASLVVELGRPAPAISSLLARAKQALHRSLLVDYLARGGKLCAENARKLPSRVNDRLEAHTEKDRGLPHVLDCDTCKINWRRFASVSTALGVLPFFTVTQLVRDETVAAAAQALPKEAFSEGSLGSTENPSFEGSASNAGGAGNASTVGGAGGAGAGAASGAAGAAGVAATVTTALSSNLALVASIALAVVGAGMVVSSFLATGSENVVVAADESSDPQVTSAETIGEQQSAVISLPQNRYGAELDVRLGFDAAGALQSIDTDFDVSLAESWQLTEVRLTLSPGTELVSTPSGLNCSGSSTAQLCTVSPGSRSVGNLLFSVNDEAGKDQGSFDLSLTAKVDGESITGSASGSW